MKALMTINLFLIGFSIIATASDITKSPLKIISAPIENKQAAVDVCRDKVLDSSCSFTNSENLKINGTCSVGPQPYLVCRGLARKSKS